MKNTIETKKSALFDFYGKAEVKDIVPLGLQHVVAAIVGIVTPALLVAGACDLSPDDRTLLVQASLLFTALATLIQLFPIFRVGAKLPVIMGTSFAYVPTLLAISNEFNLATILGAQIIGGMVAFIFGLFVKQLRVFFPPIVTGTVIFTIGLSLYSTAVRYMAGGAAAEAAGEFGSPKHWLVAIVTLLVVIICNNFTKGITKLASILVGLLSGYFLALFMGMVNFDSVAQASWFQVVLPMHFEIAFVPSACISMAIIFSVNAVQTIGDLTSTTIGGMDREPTTEELSGGIIAQGIASMLGALFGALPTASYSQNVGIVSVTRVVNRMVFVFAAAILLVAGFIPKFSSLLTTIPQAVIGGATISVFAMIAMTGIRMITTDGLSPRTITIVGLSVALGVGVTSVQGSLSGFPSWVSTVFGSSSVVISTLAAIIMNLTLPKET
jgi:NCS2 family nucleobase:cation symporter-2